MKKAGFTIIELIISLTILSLVIPIIYQVSQEIIFSTTTTTVVNDTKLINQKLIGDIKSEVTQSAIVFDNSSSYKDMITISLPPNYVLVNRNKLPTINETDKFPPNSADVGNILFMIKYLNPIELTIDNIRYRLDSYRFLYYFLAKDTGFTIDGKNPIVLLKAQSRDIYVDYVRINSISDNDIRKALVKALNNMGISYAINLKGTKFYSLDENGNIHLVNNYLIQMDASFASRHFGINTLPTGNVYYAIGYNSTGNISIPKFAIPDSTGDGFPHGFEVAIVGPRSSRDILVRIVVVAYFSGKVVGNENLSIISVPQF